MNTEIIIPNGTKVLIFSKYGYSTKPRMKGVIVDSEDSGDLSEHGSPWSVQIYEVLGDDGITYICGSIGDYYFRTEQDYIKYLNSLIAGNNRAIKNLQKNNIELKELMKINWFEEKDRVQEEKPKVYSK